MAAISAPLAQVAHIKQHRLSTQVSSQSVSQFWSTGRISRKWIPGLTETLFDEPWRDLRAGQSGGKQHLRTASGLVRVSSVLVLQEGACEEGWWKPVQDLSHGGDSDRVTRGMQRSAGDNALLSDRFSSEDETNCSEGWMTTPARELQERSTEATDSEGCSTSGNMAVDDLWLTIRAEAREDAEAEPVLASFLYSTILSHRSLERALAFHLANKLSSDTLLSSQLFCLIADTFIDDNTIREALRADLTAVKDRDPACETYSQCLLNYKGYLACQTHRVAHRLWGQGREALALALQSRASEVFHVDIHPAAKLGKGIMLDHATGLVVGETAEIGNNVSILHHVTLGGTGSLAGNRHPKVGDGVLIGAGATLLGDIYIGQGAKIGAGSVVLADVPPQTTAVGNPAKLMGGKNNPTKLKETPSSTMDQTSFIQQWSDYVI